MAIENIPEEIRDFDWMVGKWDARMRWEASDMGPAGSAEGLDTVRRGPGGLSYIGNFTSTLPEGPYEGHGVTSFDPAKKEFVSTWNDSMNPGLMLLHGHKEADRYVFEGESTDPEGHTYVFRNTYSDIRPDSYTFTMEMKNGEQWQRSMTIDYQRHRGISG